MRKLNVLFVLPALLCTVANAAAGEPGKTEQSEQIVQSGRQELTLFSGRTLGKGNAMNVSAGAPDVSFLILHAIDPNSDFGAFFRLGYLSPVEFEGGTIWIRPGITYKHSFIDKPKYNLAFEGNLGIIYYYDSEDFGNMGGFSLEPYVRLGVPIKDFMTVNTGVGIPFSMTFNADVMISNIPIAFAFGGEAFIDENMSIGFNGELGPGIWVCRLAGVTTTQVELYGSFKVGFNYRF